MSSGDDKASHKTPDQDLDVIRTQRIQQLNEIDQNIAKLLKLAAEAVQTLSSSSDRESGLVASVEERKKAFAGTASDYYALLSTVDVNLRRQILALEEAKIIPSEAPRDIPGASDVQSNKEKKSKGPGALGNFDIGWLNSRNDKIGKDMEAELWTQARELLDDLSSDDGRERLESNKMDSS